MDPDDYLDALIEEHLKEVIKFWGHMTDHKKQIAAIYTRAYRELQDEYQQHVKNWENLLGGVDTAYAINKGIAYLDPVDGSSALVADVSGQTPIPLPRSITRRHGAGSSRPSTTKARRLHEQSLLNIPRPTFGYAWTSFSKK